MSTHRVFDAVLAGLRVAHRVATRVEAAAWLLQGRPVIYGAHLRGPLTIASGDDLLISHVHIEGGPTGLAVPDLVPEEWTR